MRRIKAGRKGCELFGVLSAPADAEVATEHSEAMPVILTEPAHWDLWPSAAP